MDSVTKITNIDEIFLLFKECKNYLSPIFRGHSKDTYTIESSAIRRIKNSYKILPTNNTIIEYHIENLIEQAKSMHYHYIDNGKVLNDVELLAHLQHQGAATALIDFTKNITVALWFACKNYDYDGAIFIIPDHTDISLFKRGTLSHFQNSNLKSIFLETTDKLYIWEPSNLKTRILQQDSIFVFGLNEKLLNENARKIIISKTIKKDLSILLKKIFNVSLNTLFNDFDGFAMANGQNFTIVTSHTEKLFIKGNEEFQATNYEKAIEWYNKVIELNPDFIDAYEFMGISYIKLKNIEEAISVYKQASNKRPQEKKFDDILHSLNRIQRLTAEHSSLDVRTMCNIGRAYLKLNEPSIAIEYFKNAINEDSSFPDAYFWTGIGYDKLYQYDKSLDYYKLAIELNPNNYRYYISIGIVYEKLNNNNEARKYTNIGRNIQKNKVENRGRSKL